MYVTLAEWARIHFGYVPSMATLSIYARTQQIHPLQLVGHYSSKGTGEDSPLPSNRTTTSVCPVGDLTTHLVGCYFL